MPRLAVLLLLLGLIPAKATASPACLAHPQRQQACPNLLYRVAQLPDMTAPALICICVTDFAPLLQQPADDAGRIRQTLLEQQLQARYGQTLPIIMEILTRQR